jgi:hypothetical protein
METKDIQKAIISFQTNTHRQIKKKRMKLQEILLSTRNHELLLNAVYSMIGVALTNEELKSNRYLQIIADLNSTLHDVNTDFINILTLLKSKNDDLKTINRQIALRVFESFENRTERAFLEERRKDSLLEMGATDDSKLYEKRNEVILFSNDTASPVIDSFHFKPASSEIEDFFGNRKMTPRLAYDDMKL